MNHRYLLQHERDLIVVAGPSARAAAYFASKRLDWNLLTIRIIAIDGQECDDACADADPFDDLRVMIRKLDAAEAPDRDRRAALRTVARELADQDRSCRFDDRGTIDIVLPQSRLIVVV